MPMLRVDDKDIELDELGFLRRWTDWDRSVAIAVARGEEVGELTERHWRILAYLRDHFRSFGDAPLVRKLCKDMQLPFKQVYELFPTGPTNGACRIAGLPSCARCE